MNWQIKWVMIMMTLAQQTMGMDVSDRVNTDLTLYRSFMDTSEQIEQHGASDFSTIGTDGACDFDAAVTSIQDVIDTGIAEVRVASNGTYTENIALLNQSVIIRGGFADCSAADLNQQVVNDFATIDGSGAAMPVIRINGSDTVNLIRLENLWLTQGTSVFPNFGGGLSVDEAEVELQLLRVVMAENAGTIGAGMYVDAGIGVAVVETHVFGQDVFISTNDSSFSGGGLYCVSADSVVFSGMSFIANNTASGPGGGAYMRNGCEVSFYAQVFEDNLGVVAGIINNQTTREGGGAYVELGASLYLFGQRMCDENDCLGSEGVPVLLSGNVSDSNAAGAEPGGGLFVGDSSFQTHVYANGLIMNANQSGGHGGGVYLGENSEMVIERFSGGCWQKDRCNHILANQSGTAVGLGGAFYVNGGQLTLANVYAEENRADFGTVVAANGEEAVVTIENSVFDDNGDSGADGYSDFQVFNASLGASIAMRHSTVADNDATISVFEIDPALNSSLTLLSSVVHDPSSGNVLGLVSGDLNINCLITHESGSFVGTDVVVTDPLFVDRSAGDFHLAIGSPAIDLCQGIPMLYPLDADLQVRGWDDPTQVNALGPFDAGADESYLSDVIFEDDFDDALP